MASPADKLNINLNQNLWGLVVSFLSLGAAEHYDLCTLYWFALATSVIMVVSIVVTTFVYTKNYVSKKSGG